MDVQKIIDSMDAFMDEASKTLLDWLSNLLPRVTSSWWDDCVMLSLSFAQREIAIEKGYSVLSDFDFATLLKIADRSWYDIQTVISLPYHKRETIRKMISVRNNWVSAELPGKDVIIQDLNTILSFMEQFGGNQTVCDNVKEYTVLIEQPDSITLEHMYNIPQSTVNTKSFYDVTDSIQENSFVYLVSFPETKGVVLSLKRLGDITQYSVFFNNGVKQYYSGQIALIE